MRIGSIDFWRNQSNRKGSNPTNGIDPNFLDLQIFYRTAIIEYDYQILERAFTLNQNGIIPFHIGLVSYHKQPLLFKKDDETPWHILWEEIDDGHVYKSLKSINLASKDFDELVKKMFTRLSKRYNFQKEVRFISRPLSELDSVSKGYWLDIPNDAIIQVLVSKTIPEDCEFMIKLNSIPSISEK